MDDAKVEMRGRRGKTIRMMMPNVVMVRLIM